MTRLRWSIVVIALTLLSLVLLWQFRISIVLFLLSLAAHSSLYHPGWLSIDARPGGPLG
jgi:hypothetical protein